MAKARAHEKIRREAIRVILGERGDAVTTLTNAYIDPDDDRKASLSRRVPFVRLGRHVGIDAVTPDVGAAIDSDARAARSNRVPPVARFRFG